MLEEPSSSSDNMDARCFVKLNFWIDYFNNMKKCWEPLLEKLVLTGSYEKVEFGVDSSTL